MLFKSTNQRVRLQDFGTGHASANNFCDVRHIIMQIRTDFGPIRQSGSKRFGVICMSIQIRFMGSPKRDQQHTHQPTKSPYTSATPEQSHKFVNYAKWKSMAMPCL